jgi:integrase
LTVLERWAFLASYETGWRQFSAHGQSLGLEPLGAHPALVATFLGHLRDGGASAQTLGARAAAIRFFHWQAGLASPTDQRVVRDLLEGARREDAGRDHGRATITAKRLAASIELQGPPATPLAIRDRAILLLTFASGRRRAEIAALNVEDLDFGRPGFLIVTIRKSKTDQGGAGSSSPSRGSSTGRARSRRSKPGWPSARRRRAAVRFVFATRHAARNPDRGAVGGRSRQAALS